MTDTNLRSAATATAERISAGNPPIPPPPPIPRPSPPPPDNRPPTKPPRRGRHAMRINRDRRETEPERGERIRNESRADRARRVAHYAQLAADAKRLAAQRRRLRPGTGG